MIVVNKGPFHAPHRCRRPGFVVLAAAAWAVVAWTHSVHGEAGVSKPGEEWTLATEITSPPIKATLTSLLTAPSSPPLPPLLQSSPVPASSPARHTAASHTRALTILGAAPSSSSSRSSSRTVRIARSSTPAALGSSSAEDDDGDDDAANDSGRPPPPRVDSSLSTNAAAGIGIGSTAGGVLLLVLVGWVVHRRKRTVGGVTQNATSGNRGGEDDVEAGAGRDGGATQPERGAVGIKMEEAMAADLGPRVTGTGRGIAGAVARNEMRA